MRRRLTIRKRTALLSGLVLLTFLLLGAGAAQEQKGISVSGTGTAYGVPDRAVFQAGINVADADVTAASDQANTVTQAILDALAAAGVEKRDVRTTNFTVRREDRWSDDGTQQSPLYRVMNSVNVTVRDVTQVGELLGLVLRSGANQVNSVNFTHSNPAELERQARKFAVQDAAERASQLAELSGVQLGAPLSITESAPLGGPVPFQSARMVYSESADSSVPVAAGELGVTVEVFVTYGITGD